MPSHHPPFHCGLPTVLPVGSLLLCVVARFVVNPAPRADALAPSQNIVCAKGSARAWSEARGGPRRRP